MRVENEIEIAAPTETVWAVTMDVERWPEWTPTVTALRLVEGGALALGSVARIKQPLQPESSWTVTELVSGRRFTWETRRPGLRMAGTHELAPGGNGTKCVLRLDAGGVVAVLLAPLLWPAIRRALSLENRGLKTRCEEIVGSAAESHG